MKKKVLILLISLIVVVGVGLCYLLIDFPYPKVSTDGLISKDAGDIKETSGLRSYKKIASKYNKNVSAKGAWFVDSTGRTTILRGVNLGRSSTIPFKLENDSVISFTGRPFPLNKADEHFRRMKLWGFKFLRYVITWESIEHAGPGKYDQEYLDYTAAIIKKAGEYGFDVFIDPHEDVWCRATGGDGAPIWTLEKAGLKPENFWETGAAIMQEHFPEKLPQMVWPTNYTKLGAATMSTLFFAGNTYAPHLKVDGVPIQDYLQGHYFQAMVQLVRKLKGYKNVIGFDNMNEPQQGYIGVPDLTQKAFYASGPTPTPFECMRLGAGEQLDIPFFVTGLRGAYLEKNVLTNRNHLSAWRDVHSDIWKNEGVWGYDSKGKAVLFKKNYFLNFQGRPVDFTNDCMKPFTEKFAKAITTEDPSQMIFVENIALLVKLPELKSDTIQYVNASHAYDIWTLTRKTYFSWMDYDLLDYKWVLGRANVRKLFNKVLGKIKEDTKLKLGDAPTVIGEIGIPIDLDNGKAYVTGNYSDQEEAYDRCINSMEHHLMNYALWNYSPDNTNATGDNWNGEDLSLFSLSQQKDTSDLNSGGRALKAVVRTYPYKISGIPTQSFFNYHNGEFVLKFKNDPGITAPTEIFVPNLQYPRGYKVFLSSGARVERDSKNQMLLYFADKTNADQILVIRRK